MQLYSLFGSKTNFKSNNNFANSSDKTRMTSINQVVRQTKIRKLGDIE